MVLAGDDPGLDLDEDLDRIAGGALAWRGMLEGFWSGFHPALEKAGALERAAVLQAVEDRLHGFLFADLLEAGFSLERALSIAAQVAKDQGQRARAQLLLSWRRALLEDRFAETAADALPASEAMIFHAYGRVDAGVLFAAAARVAEMRDRQLSAVWKALAMPLVLAVGLVLLLWATGGYFVPVIETVSPPEEWSTGARLFRSMSTWLHANTLLFGGMMVALVALTAWAMVAWRGGEGRFGHGGPGARLAAACGSSSNPRPRRGRSSGFSGTAGGWCSASAPVSPASRESFSHRSGGLRPHVGIDAVIPAFLIIVLGGIGSFWGAVFGGILVGLAVGLTGAYASDWSLLSMYLLLIAVVTVRARGLLGKKSVLEA